MQLMLFHLQVQISFLKGARLLRKLDHRDGNINCVWIFSVIFFHGKSDVFQNMKTLSDFEFWILRFMYKSIKEISNLYFTWSRIYFQNIRKLHCLFSVKITIFTPTKD